MKAKELKLLRKKLAKANKIDNDFLGAFPKDSLTVAVPTQSSSTSSAEPTEHHSKWVVTYLPSDKIPKEQHEQCLDLFQRNMGKLYEHSSWGLNAASKSEELRHDKARFLLLLDEQREKLAAFVHFRFEYDDEESPTCAVLYVYEIQVDSKYRGLGVGRRLMDITRTIGRNEAMSKILLTVFKANQDAMKFYEKLGYSIDETSPSKFGTLEDYEILSFQL